MARIHNRDIICKEGDESIWEPTDCIEELTEEEINNIRSIRIKYHKNGNGYITKYVVFFLKYGKPVSYVLDEDNELLPNGVEINPQSVIFAEYEDQFGNTKITVSCTPKNSNKQKHAKSSPHYLFFHASAYGMPRYYDAPLSDNHNWPRLKQLAWIVSDMYGNLLKEQSCTIEPEGFDLPSYTFIPSFERKTWRRLEDVLNEFGEDLASTEVMVGHNAELMDKIIHAEYIRINKENIWASGPIELLCTMETSVNSIDLLGHFYESESPSLRELHEKLFAQRFESFDYDYDIDDDSYANTEATYKCFWKLRELGLIE